MEKQYTTFEEHITTKQGKTENLDNNIAQWEYFLRQYVLTSVRYNFSAGTTMILDGFFKQGREKWENFKAAFRKKKLSLNEIEKGNYYADLKKDFYPIANTYSEWYEKKYPANLKSEFNAYTALNEFCKDTISEIDILNIVPSKTIDKILLLDDYFKIILDIYNQPRRTVCTYLENTYKVVISKNPDFLKYLYKYINSVLEGIHKEEDYDLLIENGDFALGYDDFKITGKLTSLDDASIWLWTQLINGFIEKSPLTLEKEIKRFENLFLKEYEYAPQWFSNKISKLNNELKKATGSKPNIDTLSEVSIVPDAGKPTFKPVEQMQYFHKFITEVQTIEIKVTEYYVRDGEILAWTPEDVPDYNVGNVKKQKFFDLSHYNQHTSGYEAELKKLQQLALNEFLLMTFEQRTLQMNRLEQIKRRQKKFWDLYLKFSKNPKEQAEFDLEVDNLFIIPKPTQLNLSYSHIHDWHDAIMFKQGILLGFEKQIKEVIETGETGTKQPPENIIPPVASKTTAINEESPKTLAELEREEHIYWEEIPIKNFIAHFKVMTEKNSKNHKPFLTEKQLCNFIQRAVFKNSNTPKQSINLASGEKGFVIKRFYEFYSTVAVGQYSAASKKEKYIKLLSENFTNWNYDKIKPFFKPNKAKENW